MVATVTTWSCWQHLEHFHIVLDVYVFCCVFWAQVGSVGVLGRATSTSTFLQEVTFDLRLFSGEPRVEASPGRSEQTEVEDGDVSSGSCAHLSRIQVPPGGSTGSSPGPGPRWQPVPKHQERTLKLVAINSRQPVKRPAGDQPVVVLNHPDADTPQVARIMEVVSRHREVQKVLLSRRTLSALSSRSGDESEPPAAAVQERFTLKLKLRRLSRKKYEVVGSVSPGLDPGSRFPCWFCGRVFTSPDAMALHRQRHLMEWKRPNCEN